MSNYRADQLYRIITNLDRRTQTDDDTIGQDENTIQDTFFPVSEKLSLSDAVDVATYTPSTFAWGGLRPLLSPTFARTGVAYSPETGLSVKANEPRYVSGKYGMGVVVEESTTNLVTNGNFESGALGSVPAGWVERGTTTLRVDTSKRFSGTQSAKLVVTQGGSVGGTNDARQQLTGLVAGTTYTVSFKARLDESSDRATLTTVWVSQPKTHTLTTSWQTFTHTVAATATGHNVFFGYNVNEACNFVCHIDDVQVEAKTYATSFTPSTRNAETLTLPTTGLTPTQGTIAAWVYVNSVARRQVAGQGPRIYEVSVSNGGVWVQHRPDSANWEMRFNDGVGGVKSVTIPDSLTPDGWHRFVIRWSATQATLSIDGVVRGTISAPPLPSALQSTVYVGCNALTGSHLNTYFDNVVVDTIAWSDAQVAADYASGVPYAPTATTTAVVNFDGSLTGESLAYAANFDWNGGAKWNA